MLKIKEIAQIYEQADMLYRKYRKAYFELQRNFYENAGDVKYSAGGTAYPAGKYFWGESKVYRKAVRKSPGHFCRTTEGANYVYGFSEDGRLLAFDKIFEPQESSYYTGFCVYDGEYIYLPIYRGAPDRPELADIGIIRNTESCKIMAEVPAPQSLRELCTFLDITVIDNERNNEYLYSFSRGIFSLKYDLTSEDEYPEFMVLNK